MLVKIMFEKRTSISSSKLFEAQQAKSHIIHAGIAVAAGVKLVTLVFSVPLSPVPGGIPLANSTLLFFWHLQRGLERLMALATLTIFA